MFSALSALENIGLIRVYNGSTASSSQLELNISDETALLLGISPIEARIVLENKQLKILDKVRDAALRPLEPLHDGIIGDRTSLTLT